MPTLSAASHYSTLAPAYLLAERNLQMLDAITRTVESLHAGTAVFRAMEQDYRAMHKRLKAEQGEIDVDKKLDAALDAASDHCAFLWREIKERRQAALADPILPKNSGVVQAYTQNMTALHRLHDTIEEVREWVGIHDARLSPRVGKVYDDVDEMFKDLLSDTPAI